MAAWQSHVAGTTTQLELSSQAPCHGPSPPAYREVATPPAEPLLALLSVGRGMVSCAAGCRKMFILQGVIESEAGLHGLTIKVILQNSGKLSVYSLMEKVSQQGHLGK